MKTILHKLRGYFGGVNSLILILYTTFILAAQALVSRRYSPSFVMTAGLLGLILSAVLCPLLLRFLSGRNSFPRAQRKDISKWGDLCINCGLCLIPLAVFLVFFLGFYPGGFSVDSYNQYKQVLKGQYDDWHPVLHTLLAFKLPLMLSGGWIGSVVLVQSLCFSGAIGYSCCVIRKHFGTLRAVIAMFWILMNPVVMMTSMHPWKDVGFAICALLLGTYALQTVVTKGQWLRRPVCMICFGVVTVVASIVRHNGILFTAPVVLGLVLYLSKKRALALCMGIILLFVAVKGPLYSVLDVEEPDQRQVEMLGLPMTVIGAVVANNPGALDEETLEFAYRVTPKEVWEELYDMGSYNSVKFEKETDNDVIEEYGAVKVLSMMVRAVKADPSLAMSGFVQLTKRLFAFWNAGTSFATPRVTNNKLGVEQNSNMILNKLCNAYATRIRNYFPHVFLHLGIQHYILLAFLLAKIKLKDRQNISKLLVVMGVFCYNFGSGLLLTTGWDIHRFFFYTFALMPVMLLLLCYNENERSRPLFVWRKK